PARGMGRPRRRGTRRPPPPALSRRRLRGHLQAAQRRAHRGREHVSAGMGHQRLPQPRPHRAVEVDGQGRHLERHRRHLGPTIRRRQLLAVSWDLHEDGYAYIYSSQYRDGYTPEGQGGSDLFLWRVPHDRIEDKSAYESWGWAEE